MTVERFLSGRVTLHCGNCLDVLAGLAPDAIDSCVTDPPYHLTSIVQRFGNTIPAQEQFATNNNHTGYRRLSTGFMGKVWDGGDIAFRPETWAAVYRVLKPGAHLVAMGGTRTYHRLACAIEDAGFEIRDTVSWLYGSGFPKSHDVSKGIDRRRIEDIEPIRVVCRFLRAALDRQGLVSWQLVEHFDNCHPRLIDHWAARDTDSQPSLPTWPQWLKLKTVLNLGDEMDDEVARLNERKGTPSEDYQNRPDADYSSDVGMRESWTAGRGWNGNLAKGGDPVRDAARQWQGWGTALKPACELIVLARKPLSEGTVAANVLRWGTGAINVDGCRVATDGEDLGDPSRFNGQDKKVHEGWMRPHKNDDARMAEKQAGAFERMKSGRWPANVVHDGSDEVVAAFPETISGNLQTHHKLAESENCSMSGKNYAARSPRQDMGGDSGSAARFYYTSKADSDDRLGSKHPTVKPLDLMQWLVRLITPPKGIVLDCFAGTGTTGEAAWREGMSAVLIEAEAEYQADIRRRMALVLAGPDERSRESIKARGMPVDYGPLFDGLQEAAE